MPISKAAVDDVVGKPRSEFQCNHVVNMLLNGDKNVGGTAHSYLNYGHVTETPSAGVVVVGADGAHVGIFIDSTTFVHSSVTRGKVIPAGLDQLNWVFPLGYELRTR